MAEEEGIAGMRHERIAQAISPKIQRRAGVAPGAQNNYYDRAQALAAAEAQKKGQRKVVEG